MLHFCTSMYLWASEEWRKNQSSNNKIEVNNYKAAKALRSFESQSSRSNGIFTISNLTHHLPELHDINSKNDTGRKLVMRSYALAPVP